MIDIAQPAIFAVEVALTELLRSCGIFPSVVVGHGVGEIAASHAAGVLTLPQAVKVIYHCGRLLRRTVGNGTMLAVFSDVETVKRHLPPQSQFFKEREDGYQFENIDIAAVNSPSQVVLSGSKSALEQVQATLKRSNISAIFLPITSAFHSYQQATLQASVLKKLRKLQSVIDATCSVPMMSTVTADYVTSEMVASAEYWWTNIRSQVRFKGAIENLLNDGFKHFIEIGAHSVLVPAMKQIFFALGLSQEAHATPTLRRSKDISQVANDRHNFLYSLGSLYITGVTVDFTALYRPNDHTFTPLPLYPWQRELCWTCDSNFTNRNLFPVTSHPLLGQRRAVKPKCVEKESIVWQCSYDGAALPWLADHVIQENVVIPAAAHLEICYEAAKQLVDSASFLLINVTLEHRLFAKDSKATVTTVAERRGRSTYSIGVYTQHVNGTWQRHSHSIISTQQQDDVALPIDDFDAVKERCVRRLSMDDFYKMVNSLESVHGFSLGSAFKGVKYALMNNEYSECLALVEAPSGVEREMHKFNCHPALLDTCLQSIFLIFESTFSTTNDFHCFVSAFGVTLALYNMAASFSNAAEKAIVSYPDFVGGFKVNGLVPPRIWVLVKITGTAERKRSGAVTVIDHETGRTVVQLTDVTVTSILKANDERPHFWRLEWKRLSQLSLSGSEKIDVSRTFAVFATTGTLGQRLSDDLSRQSVTNDLFEFEDTDSFPANFESRANELLQSATPFTDIVMLTTGGVKQRLQSNDDITTMTYEQFEEYQRRFCWPVIHLVQELAQQYPNSVPNVWIITAGCKPVDDKGKIDSLQSTVAALALTVSHEHPDIPLTLIDLPLSMSDKETTLTLICYLSNNLSYENEVSLQLTPDGRDVSVYVARVREIDENEVNGDDSEQTNWNLIRKGRGRATSTITAAPFSLEHSLTDGRIIVKVNSFVPVDHNTQPTQTQFDFTGEITGWFSGSVVRSSNLKDKFEEGNCVTGLSSQIGKYILVSEDVIASKPQVMSHEEAVWAAKEMFQPWLSLTMGAKCKAGDIVLIYVDEESNTLPACQVAISLGTRVLVVADDRCIARIPPLRGCSVVSKRELATVGETMQTLFGSAKAEVLLFGSADVDDEMQTLTDVLCPFGSVVVYSLKYADKLDQRKDAIQLVYVNPSLTIREWNTKSKIVSAYSIFMTFASKAINEWRRAPVTTQSISQWQRMTPDRAVQTASLHDFVTEIDQAVNPCLPRTAHFFVSLVQTYLITGGLKGFGLGLARWLVAKGARYVALLGRSAATDEALSTVRELQDSGVTVNIFQADVANERDLDDAFYKICQSMPPIGGIFHCAAVYADSWLMKMNEETYFKVLMPKAYGAILLHQQTVKRQLPIKHFVLISSVVSLFGNSGQGSYCAANSFLNALAEWRIQRKLPATAILFGPIGDEGYLARSQDVMKQLEKKGFSSLTLDEAVDAMARVLCLNIASIGIQGNADVKLMVRNFVTSHGPMKFSRVKDYLVDAENSESDSSKNDHFSLITLSAEERFPFVVNMLSKWLETNVGIESVRHDDVLVSIGVDSITASDLSSHLSQKLNILVPPVRLLNDRCTVKSLARTVVDMAEQEKEESSGDHPDINNGIPENGSGKTTNSTTRWLHTLTEPSDVNMIVVCFPPTSFGLSSFSKFKKPLQKANVHALVVVPPGWSGREGERCINDLELLVTEAVNALLPHLEQSQFVFYGHSFGSLIAYEVANRLQTIHGLSPLRLFVGAWYAPHLSALHVNSFSFRSAIFDPSNSVADVLKFAQQLPFIEKDPMLFKRQHPVAVARFRNQVLPCIETTFNMSLRYVGDNGRLSCGITAFSGKDDSFVSLEHVIAWKEHAVDDQSFEHISVPGGHNFLRSLPKQALSAVVRSITSLQNHSIHTNKDSTNKTEAMIQ